MSSVKIQGVEVTEANYLDPVTYVPRCAIDDNPCDQVHEQGVIIGVLETTVRVLYCNSRKVRITNPDNLIWG